MSSLHRREFLRLGGATALGAALFGCAAGPRPAWSHWPVPDRAPRAGKLRLGVVGVGGRGSGNLSAVSGEIIAALCDVDTRPLSAARQRHPDARTFADYRIMLDSVALDGVVISTPDHMHGPVAMAALERGLDVYCEKPLGRRLDECHSMQGMAAHMGAVIQMGTQIHAEPNYRRVVERVRSGVLGEITSAHCWVGKAWGGATLPTDTPPVPAGLDWPLWLGVAPERPYHPAFHPAGWRRYWDYGTGTLGDMGCHHLDLPFWALDLNPEAGGAEVFASSPDGPADPHCAPRSLSVTWRFGAQGRAAPGSGPLTLHWHDGGIRPPQFAQGLLPEWGDGTLFVGTEGMLLADYGRHALVPEARFADVAPPAPSLPDSPGHHREWLEACRTRSATSCGFEYAARLSRTVLAGVEAFRNGHDSADQALRFT
jgi:predicted dehydrogenase